MTSGQPFFAPPPSDVLLVFPAFYVWNQISLIPHLKTIWRHIGTDILFFLVNTVRYVLINFNKNGKIKDNYQIEGEAKNIDFNIIFLNFIKGHPVSGKHIVRQLYTAIFGNI